MSPTRQVGDRAVLLFAGLWAYLRHPWLCVRTLRHSRSLPHLSVPRSEVDKFLWRKIFDRNPLFMMACDKLAAKAFARSLCPELKFAELLWSGHDPDEIPERLLAGSVVVKANHGSRWNVVVRDGAVDLADLRRQARDWMARQYGRSFGEWAYVGAARSILIEEMLGSEGEAILSEYKFHVSGGRTTYVILEQTAASAPVHKLRLDRDGHLREVLSGGKEFDFTPPACFDRMRRIAEALSAPFDFIRCDLYEHDGEIYFSEFSVYPQSGVGTGNRALDVVRLRNDLWDLRRSWFLSEPQRGFYKAYASALRRALDRAAGHRSVPAKADGGEPSAATSIDEAHR